ncbi:MAG: 16S rRNA (adenine(1518)-N(6)/adenine(1519)-N(6))-dimethyltransferase RsmA [Lachnospiraceae bacterium]|nr:16S rRNA (adenine(1518)-N(6)/adenine(1519)-N(6))-dimethyltransferase RsmA [Lachnospiraceae bacterium]
MALVDPKNTIEVLKDTGFSFKKSLGQNFLIDESVLRKIIDAACLTKEDCVLEIGPGIGTMTEALSEAAGRVIAVELDNRLIPILRENLRGRENVTVIQGDILRTDIRKLSEEHCGGKPFKAVANLPYSVTTPALLKLLDETAPILSATLMVQKEVAERMMADPGTKAYGALSLAVQYRAEISVAANVPRNCFIPRPEVDSQVVHLQCFPEPPVRTEDPELMFRLIRASFNERRKTLVNGLSNGKIGYSKEEILRAVAALGKGEAVRGETLSLQDFTRLADLFKNPEF